MKATSPDPSQLHLLKQPLENLINPTYPLCILTKKYRRKRSNIISLDCMPLLADLKKPILNCTHALNIVSALPQKREDKDPKESEAVSKKARNPKYWVFQGRINNRDNNISFNVRPLAYTKATLQ